MQTFLKRTWTSLRDGLASERPVVTNAPKYLTVVCYLVVIILSLALRIHIAGMAYPAEQDSVHLVQAGVKWALGAPDQFSGINQEAPVLVAGLAFKAGLDPALSLQGFTVLLGTLVTLFSMTLTWRLFYRHIASIMVGLWTAANPGLIQYSVNSMPEIGFAALMLASFTLVAGFFRSQVVRTSSVVGAFALLGLGIYFKPLDALVMVIVLMGAVVLANIGRIKSLLPRLVIGVLAYVAVVSPHYYLQSQAKQENALNVGLVNRAGGLVKGLRAYDSRYEYGSAHGNAYAAEVAELRDLGMAKWIWKHRMEIGQRYVRNMASCVRSYGDFLFTHSFRMGTAWFAVLLAVALLSGLLSTHWRKFSFLSLVAFAIPAGVSLSYVFDRWLIIYLPILMMAMVGCLTGSSRLFRVRIQRAAWLVILLSMAGSSALAVNKQYRSEAWHWGNHYAFVERLAGMVGSEDRIMSGRPTLMLDMDLEHSDRWVQLPPNEIDEVERIADERNVAFVVLSDTFYPHWPVNQILVGEDTPANWTLVDEVFYEQDHPMWGNIRETYRVYRRGEP